MPWTVLWGEKTKKRERKKERKERSKHVKNAFYKESYDDDELMLNVLRCHLTYWGQVVTNAEARFNKSHIRNVYACLAVMRV